MNMQEMKNAMARPAGTIMAAGDVPALDKLHSRLENIKFQLIDINGTIGSFHERAGGASPEKSAGAGVPTCAPNGSIEKIGQELDDVQRFVSALSERVNLLNKIA